MTLAASKNTHDWLGYGIYFWENAPARALAWAKECRNNLHLTSGKVTDPFVIGAIIDISFAFATQIASRVILIH